MDNKEFIRRYIEYRKHDNSRLIETCTKVVEKVKEYINMKI